MRRNILFVGLSVLVLAGCSRTYEPPVDFQSSTAPRSEYDRNLAECQNIAGRENVAKDTAIGGGIGAAVGAAAGAITGAFFGSAGTGAAAGAALGGLGGAGTEAYRGTANQKQIVRNCLRGRGYNVVGE